MAWLKRHAIHPYKTCCSLKSGVTNICAKPRTGVVQGIFDSNEAHELPMAEPFHSKLTTFQKLLFLRCIRPDKVMMAIQAFVVEHMGARFIEPPPFDLSATYRESDATTPLIFVLSAGADPMLDLLKLADEMKFSKKFEKVSLGQGQGPKAERLLREGMERGLWVCLQNCHLAVSWMPSMERIIEGIEKDKVCCSRIAHIEPSRALQPPPNTYCQCSNVPTPLP